MPSERIRVVEKALALQETAVWKAATADWSSSDWSAVFIVAWFQGWSDDRCLVAEIADLLTSQKAAA